MVFYSLKPALFLTSLNWHFINFKENIPRRDNMGKIFGYARVSTQEQNLDMQSDALQEMEQLLSMKKNEPEPEKIVLS